MDASIRALEERAVRDRLADLNLDSAVMQPYLKPAKRVDSRTCDSLSRPDVEARAMFATDDV